MVDGVHVMQAPERSATAQAVVALDSDDSSSGTAQSTELGFANYRPKSVLYKGRRSKVVAAVHADTGETVAIKLYTRSQMSTNDLNKIERELKLFRDLRHGNIVRGIDSWSDADNIFLVQEFASRGDLCDVAGLFDKKCIPEVSVAHKIVKPILHALSFLHTNSVIHRDLKPENVVVTADGTTKICDFGLAIDTRLEVPAPEILALPRITIEEKERLRAARAAQYTRAVDIWALGCVAFEVLYGIALFGGSPEQIEFQVVHESNPVHFPRCTRAGLTPSSAAVEFLSAALVYSSELRPSADALLAHRWLRRASVTCDAAALPAEAEAKRLRAPVAGGGPGSSPDDAAGPRGRPDSPPVAPEMPKQGGFSLEPADDARAGSLPAADRCAGDGLDVRARAGGAAAGGAAADNPRERLRAAATDSPPSSPTMGGSAAQAAGDPLGRLRWEEAAARSPSPARRGMGAAASRLFPSLRWGNKREAIVSSGSLSPASGSSLSSAPPSHLSSGSTGSVSGSGGWSAATSGSHHLPSSPAATTGSNSNMGSVFGRASSLSPPPTPARHAGSSPRWPRNVSWNLPSDGGGSGVSAFGEVEEGSADGTPRTVLPPIATAGPKGSKISAAPPVGAKPAGAGGGGKPLGAAARHPFVSSSMTAVVTPLSPVDMAFGGVSGSSRHHDRPDAGYPGREPPPRAPPAALAKMRSPSSPPLLEGAVLLSDLAAAAAASDGGSQQRRDAATRIAPSPPAMPRALSDVARARRKDSLTSRVGKFVSRILAN